MAKGIAYVLRNPSVPDHERAEFLSQLQASLDKLMGIVDEIITIAELERGTFELNLAEVDLAPLLRHAVDESRLAYPQVEIDDTIADTLRGDRRRRADRRRGAGAAGQRLPLLSTRAARGAHRPVTSTKGWS